ncbi:MAG TPA: hypothetical protein VKU00_18655 [Chthonomonadaceae bacterium]|nr:hypothetical protein [Chthonomonadaceae bacterium]
MRNRTLTYGQLEYLLTELGYRLTPSPEQGARLWENPKFDAIKYLPAAPPHELARPHYLMTIRKVSIEKGIVEESDFNRLLEKALQHGLDPTASPSAA